MQVIGRKVIVSREEVAAFNRQWPCSELRETRHYWFEFDQDGDLIDTDVPKQDDGQAVHAMSQDCLEFLTDRTSPDWAIEETIPEMSFEDLQVGQEFDWINPKGPNSFFRRCVKTSARKYRTCSGGPIDYFTVGSIKARVFNVVPL